MDIDTEIKITWEVEDGFVCGKREYNFTIDARDLEGMDESEIEEHIEEMVAEDFQSRVSYSCDTPLYTEQALQILDSLEENEDEEGD